MDNYGWKELIEGVSYKKTVASNPDVLMVVGGWGVKDGGAWAWADALLGTEFAKKGVLKKVGHAYAVRGPKKDKQLTLSLIHI